MKDAAAALVIMLVVMAPAGGVVARVPSEPQDGHGTGFTSPSTDQKLQTSCGRHTRSMSGDQAEPWLQHSSQYATHQKRRAVKQEARRRMTGRGGAGNYAKERTTTSCQRDETACIAIPFAHASGCKVTNFICGHHEPQAQACRSRSTTCAVY